MGQNKYESYGYRKTEEKYNSSILLYDKQYMIQEIQIRHWIDKISHWGTVIISVKKIGGFRDEIIWRFLVIKKEGTIVVTIVSLG